MSIVSISSHPLEGTAEVWQGAARKKVKILPLLKDFIYVNDFYVFVVVDNFNPLKFLIYDALQSGFTDDVLLFCAIFHSFLSRE